VAVADQLSYYKITYYKLWLQVVVVAAAQVIKVPVAIVQGRMARLPMDSTANQDQIIQPTVVVVVAVVVDSMVVPGAEVMAAHTADIQVPATPAAKLAIRVPAGVLNIQTGLHPMDETQGASPVLSRLPELD
jgi:hypothetical protein